MGWQQIDAFWEQRELTYRHLPVTAEDRPSDPAAVEDSAQGPDAMAARSQQPRPKRERKPRDRTK
jgi:hypothetical protein